MAPALVSPPLRAVRSRLFDSARWAAWRSRADDIVIATYPKCGTTWSQRIVCMLLVGDAAPAPLSGPWFDFRLRGPAEAVAAEAEAIGRRRYLQSHLPLDALPLHASPAGAGVKVIHVARDGRDAAMSFHNHLRGFTEAVWASIDAVSLADPKFGDPAPRPPEDAAEYFRGWLADGGAMGDPGASYWAVERSYWAARRRPDVLLVHYADLKADLAGEIARIAAFLGVALPAAVMAGIVRAASFEAMQGQADALMPGAGEVWQGGARRFIYKGVNGRWKDVLGAGDLAAYQARTAAEVSPALAAWLESGRLAAGDPATTPD